MVLEDAEVIYPSCAGLDVHKKTVVVCVRKITDEGKLIKDFKTFETMTEDLIELRDWLKQYGVTHVAMESTGSYWKPIWNVLEGHFKIMLVNAQHLEKVPGRKTDMKDCEWIAKCLQLGLLKGSFIPDTALREMRDLTRHRVRLIEERTSVIQRIQRELEDANIKLSSVASDTLGASGLSMIREIIVGQDNPEQLADLAKGRLRSKIPELRKALTGYVRQHHRFMLDLLLRELESLDAFIEEISQRIEQASDPFEEAVSICITAVGVKRRIAENLVAEFGTDMKQFPTERHMSSWVGISPGNNESAGKRKNGRITKGNRWAKRALIEAAWAASHAKNSYFQAQYKRIAHHRGKKRAIVAVGHSICVTLYHMLSRKVAYKDLGPDYFINNRKTSLRDYHLRQLQKLGFKVQLEVA